MASFNSILFEMKDKIAFVTLNRPNAMNALGGEMIDELKTLFLHLSKEDVLGVVITGTGRAFCAGADLTGSSNSSGNQFFATRDFVNEVQELMNQIESFPTPVMAAINGFALGGGCELALSCDLRIASTDAVFGLPETTLGVIPCFGGTQRLPRTIGVAAAKEMIYTGRKVGAKEALSLGIINELVSPEQLMEVAENRMKKIATNAPLAIKMAKISINKGIEMPLHYALEFETDMVALLGTTEDATEGGRAFLERRKANFKNK